MIMVINLLIHLLCCSSPHSFIRIYPQVALTRDLANNLRMQQIFHQERVGCINLPCLEFSSGKDQITKEHLRDMNTIVITSSQV